MDSFFHQYRHNESFNYLDEIPELHQDDYWQYSCPYCSDYYMFDEYNEYWKYDDVAM